MTLLGPQVTAYDLLGQLQSRTGNRSSHNAPRNVYRTADGSWVAVSASATSIAERVLRLVGRPAPIYDARDIVADPHLAAVGAFHALDDEELGTITMTNVVSRLSDTPGAIEWAGARHGRDTEAVFAELGVDEEELARLRGAGVV